MPLRLRRPAHKMSHFPYHFLILAVAAGISSAATDAPGDAPWEKPRDIRAFESLLARSPFSLPTAEESSPLADRFSLTGAADINGETMVFVIDRTTQARQMISKKSDQNMSLVEYLPDPDSRKMKAVIRVDGQIATIAFSEPSAPQPGQQGQSPMPGQANHPQPPAGPLPMMTAGGATPKPTTIVNVPPPLPGSPSFKLQGGPSASPPRRVIRRRTISGQTSPGQ